MKLVLMVSSAMVFTPLDHGFSVGNQSSLYYTLFDARIATFWGKKFHSVQTGGWATASATRTPSTAAETMPPA